MTVEPKLDTQEEKILGYILGQVTLLAERHADQIAGVLSCYDRILIFEAVVHRDGQPVYP